MSGLSLAHVADVMPAEFLDFHHFPHIRCVAPQEHLVSIHGSGYSQGTISMEEAWDVQEQLSVLHSEVSQEDTCSVHEKEDSCEEQCNGAEEPLRTDLSVEPVLIIRSPPPNFLPAPGPPCMPWDKWLRLFENHVHQMEEGKLTDSTKYVLLQNCLGQEGQRILATLLPGETTYMDAISTLGVYFSSSQPLQVHMLGFNQRAQMNGESAGQFISALDQLLKPLNYQELYEQLLIKQLIEKTNNPRLKQRLLSEPGPYSLARALQISAEVESTAEVSVYLDEAEPPVKRKRGRPRKSEVRAEVKAAAKAKPAAKISSAVNAKFQRTAVSRGMDDYYYSGDEQYYADSIADVSESSFNVGLPSTVAKLKEIKTEPSDNNEVRNLAKRNGLSCPICPGRHFRGINKLMRHMRSHSQDKPYTCPVCSVTFSQTYHLLRHMRRQHDAGEHICSLCGVTLASVEELQQHKKSHPAEPVTCPLCQEVCSSPRVFAAHVKNHCNTPLSSEELEHLPKMKRRYKKKQDGKKSESIAVTNLSDENTSVNAILSQGDAASFSSSISQDESSDHFDFLNQDVDAAGIDKLTEKLLLELRTEDSDDENEALIKTDLKHPHCHICDHAFPSLHKLLRHMQTHTKQKPFLCPLCSLSFSQGYHLTRHMKVQHGAGLYVCPKCGVDLASAAELQTHRRVHPPDPVVCPYCDKISPNYHKFLGHFRRHGKLSMTEEQVAGVGKPVSDSTESSDISDSGAKKNHVGQWELVDQKVDGAVEPVQKQEIVRPTILKRKRGRPKRVTRSSAQTNISQSELNTEEPVTLNSDIDDIGEGSSQTQGQSPLESQEEDGSDGEYLPGNDKHSQKKKFKKSKSNVCKSNLVEVNDKDEKSIRKIPKRHCCPICKDRWFRGANKLSRHMTVHTKEKAFKCPICDKAFSQSYHMKRHHRVQHSQGRYTCTVCGQNLANWIEFKNHKSLHEPGVVCCPFCDKQFKHKSLYLSHIKSHKNSSKRITGVQKSFACSDCGSVFKRKNHLKRHILRHRKESNGEYYTCSTCGQTFAFSEDLKRHMKKHEKEQNGICPLCSETFNSPEELQTHKEELHNRIYPCSVCGRKFKLEHALKKHEESHLNGQYYCVRCAKFFQKQSHYKRHMLVHRKRERTCPHCYAVFIKLNAFHVHLRTHINERPYQCVCCPESFEHKEEFDYHCLKHKKLRKDRPYSCTRCDWAFATLTELADHMISHEGEQPANCPVCGKSFLNKNKLEKHMSIHTGVRPHLCSICGNGFPSAASLKLHVNVHTGYKPFQCDQCPKSFSTNSSLKLHSRQHMAVRPKFECPDCGRTYGRKTELKMHQRYHTGDKPHACTCCTKRFISRDKLNVHMRIHTGERPYSCPHCGQTFSQTGDRNRHMKKFH